MRFSITSLVVIGTYLLTTARAGELAASTEALQFGTEAKSGATLRELLIERQGCQQGFGVCSNTGACCPLGGGCCPNGKCCGAGTWCYTPTICCSRNDNGCANQGCCPQGSNCCADGRCCPKGNFCYRSSAHGGAIRCCPEGQTCA